MKKIFHDIYYKMLIHKSILIPILLVLIIPSASSALIGRVYIEKQLNHIPIVIVDHDNSSLSKELVKQISTNPLFRVVEYRQSDDDVKNSLENGTTVAGIIIPNKFSEEVVGGRAPKIMVIYDGSQMSAVGTIKLKIAEVLGTVRAGYLMSLQEGKLGIMPDTALNNAMPIQITTRLLGNPTKSMTEFIIVGALVSTAQFGIFCLGVLVPKNRNCLQLFMQNLICAGIGSVSIFLSLLIQVNFFDLPYRGSSLAAILLVFLFCTGMSALGILSNLIVKDKFTVATKMMSPIMVTFVLSGYTYPLLGMPDIFTTISKFIPIAFCAIPLRDLFLMERTLIDILPNLLWLLMFVGAMWAVIWCIITIKRISGDHQPIEEVRV